MKNKIYKQLRPTDVQQIRVMLKTGYTKSQIIQHYSVSRTVVEGIINNRTFQNIR